MDLQERSRILGAAVELISDQSYEATTVSEIARRAGLARQTVHEHLGGEEEIFLAAFDAAVDELKARIEAACAKRQGGTRERIEAGLAAFLGYVAEEPSVARMCLVEARSATPAISSRYEDAVRGFVELTQQAVRHDQRPPKTLEESLVGGVIGIVYRRVCRGEADLVEELLPELSEFMLAPFVRP